MTTAHQGAGSATTTPSPGPGASASPSASTSRPGSAAPTSTRRSPSRWRPSRASRGARSRRTRWRRPPARSSAALIVRWTYTDVICGRRPRPHHQDPGRLLHAAGQRRATGQHHRTRFFDQIIGTAILRLRDLRDHRPPQQPAAGQPRPVVVGLLVVGIGMAWGTNAGYAINPARDFGPRLASLPHRLRHGAARTSTAASTSGCPIVGPLIGGLIGGGVYKLLIERLPARGRCDEDPPVPSPGGRQHRPHVLTTRPHRPRERRRTSMAGLRRRRRPGHHQHPLHDLRPRRQRGGPAPARARADPAAGRLGRAQPGGDLGAHQRR